MLFLGPDRLLQFLGIGIHTPLARAVAILLIVKMSLILCLLFYVCFKRLKRQWQRRNNEGRADAFRQAIVDYLFTDPERNAFLPQFKKKDRYFFRRILLDQLENIESAERSYLVKLYSHFQFLYEDLRELKSFFWWNRLAAVIRLEIVRTQDAVPMLSRLIDDKNDLVAIASMRALSTLDYPDKISKILYSLSRRAPERHDIFVEILTNIGRGQSEKIIDYLNECFDPSIAAICVSVLGALKAKEALPLCVGLLTSSSDDVAAESAKALGKIGDPQAILFLRKEIHHESAKVRAEVVISLLSLGDSDFELSLGAVQKDPSVIVRRALFDASQEK
ncbi:MAG: HEAT repeat domain-containing protein [Deltaproteobacteria bacterium]|nr:HEAT repeat domain-containing protein [Deltaproteobacteria bacterium]